MVDRNESIAAEKWNTLAKDITKLANDKQVEIYHTKTGSEEDLKEILPTDTWMEKNTRVKTDQVADILGAINQLEGSFERNCCQKQCRCQKNCYNSCQSSRTETRTNYIHDVTNCTYIDCDWNVQVSCQRYSQWKDRQCNRKWKDCLDVRQCNKQCTDWGECTCQGCQAQCLDMSECRRKDASYNECVQCHAKNYNRPDSRQQCCQNIVIFHDRNCTRNCRGNC